MSLKGKVAIITGAGSGIGSGLAFHFAKKGVKLLLNDIDPQNLSQVSQQIEANGGRCLTVIGDAGDIACINNMVHTAVDAFGSLDIAIANAGITTFGDFKEYSEAQLDTLLRVNIKGSFFLAQSAAKAMIKLSTAGRIIMMSSVTGFQYHKDLVAYGMTKAALRHLIKTLGVELAPHQITVNGIAPGATMTDRTLQLEENYKELWQHLTPNGNVAEVGDVCAAIMFFASDAARHITGQTLIIDGGWTAISPQP